MSASPRFPFLRCVPLVVVALWRVQCKDYMRHFFKMCKRRTVPPDILRMVTTIVELCEASVAHRDGFIDPASGQRADASTSQGASVTSAMIDCDVAIT